MHAWNGKHSLECLGNSCTGDQTMKVFIGRKLWGWQAVVLASLTSPQMAVCHCLMKQVQWPRYKMEKFITTETCESNSSRKATFFEAHQTPKSSCICMRRKERLSLRK